MDKTMGDTKMSISFINAVDVQHFFLNIIKWKEIIAS